MHNYDTTVRSSEKDGGEMLFHFHTLDPDASMLQRWLETVLTSAATTATIGLISVLLGMAVDLLTPHRIRFEYDYASGRAEVCSGRAEGIAFDVEFRGDHEQGIRIWRHSDDFMVVTFNNYHGKSEHVSTAVWDRGGGRYVIPPQKRAICYHVIGFHKETGPNPSVDWIASHMRFGADRTSVTFAPRQDLFERATRVKGSRCKPDGNEESEKQESCEVIE